MDGLLCEEHMAFPAYGSCCQPLLLSAWQFPFEREANLFAKGEGDVMFCRRVGDGLLVLCWCFLRLCGKTLVLRE